jgi:hypothetical protein
LSSKPSGQKRAVPPSLELLRYWTPDVRKR